MPKASGSSACTATQGDVGPVMGEGVIDLGDASDPPVVLVVPGDTLRDGFLRACRRARARRRVWWWRG